MLSESKEQQQKLAEQIAVLTAQKAAEKPASASATLPAAKVNATPAPKVQLTTSYLNDLTWAFNQNGQLPFYQNRVEPKKLVQLSELLSRLGESGFKGNAWITLYVGNFCLVLDNYGIAQLPKDTASVNECVFSSEIYGIDRIMEEYTHDAEAALNSVQSSFSKNIQVLISASTEPENYPEQKTTLTAKTWNATAQNHNRIELRLEATKP